MKKFKTQFAAKATVDDKKVGASPIFFDPKTVESNMITLFGSEPRKIHKKPIKLIRLKK